MKNYCVYILRCSDKSCYTGITNKIDRRLYEHNNGLNVTCYTYDRRPLELVFTQYFNDVHQAIAFEKQIKGWSRKKKEAIINNEWDKLPRLSKNRQLK